MSVHNIQKTGLFSEIRKVIQKVLCFLKKNNTNNVGFYFNQTAIEDTERKDIFQFHLL